MNTTLHNTADDRAKDFVLGWLRAKGYKAEPLRAEFGAFDIIAAKDAIVVLIEVKERNVFHSTYPDMICGYDKFEAASKYRDEKGIKGALLISLYLDGYIGIGDIFSGEGDWMDGPNATNTPHTSTFGRMRKHQWRIRPSLLIKTSWTPDTKRKYRNW